MFIQKGNISSLGAMLSSLHTDLVAAGFKSVLPSQSQPLVVTGGVGVFVVESDASNNPVNEKQAYRIRVEVAKKGEGHYMTVVVAGRGHIGDLGETYNYPEVVRQQSQYLTTTQIMGLLGTGLQPIDSTGSSGPAATGPGGIFIHRGLGEGTSVQDAGALGKAYSDAGAGVNYGYTLSVGSHGVVLYTWENATEGAPIFSMFCVQVPVNKDTGAPLVDLKSPIFCVYSNNNTPMMKFVVNESDVSTPTKSVLAGTDSFDSAAIINEEDQVAVKLDNKYLVTFPNRVNTERFAYSEELDMLAYTSAKVIGEDTVLELSVYNGPEKRKYRAMKANKANNNGMRLLVLQSGAGVDDTAHVAGGGNAGDGGDVAP